MKHLIWALLVGAMILAACANDGGGGEDDEWACPIDAPLPAYASAVFTTPTNITNTYFPLVPGTVNVFRAQTEDGLETTVTEVTSNTKTVDGVLCVEVYDRVFVDDLLIEETYDWYAQDDAGNVWYFGEDSTEFEYDDDDILIGSDTGGSWEGGADILSLGYNATPGIIMEASPAVMDEYRQEYYQGEAEDQARVVALNVPIVLADGRSFNCLQTLEATCLEEDSEEYKFYAPGIGLVREEVIDDGVFTEHKATFLTGPSNTPDFGSAVFSSPTTIDNPYFTLTPGNSYMYRAETEEGVETIIVDVTSQTKTVNGLTCVVVHDRVYFDGRLIEDTWDWYAQDDAGNVWYMGEDVVDYFYDATGAVSGTSTAGSWEAGVGGAVPGINMLASPTAGDAYEQEYWAGEAEDVAMVLATGLTVTLSNGAMYTGCIQTIDWNPFNPTAIESKFFAPAGAGPGIKEIEIDGEEVVELTLTTP
ncbi:MAG: hypothetical protein H6839_10470 [Planctomycetes bacterium]|nr:hypothetical protein [Planctomycetota bacterium]